MTSVTYKDRQITIYEYPDAEECIKTAALAHLGDITNVSRGGRGRNKCEYYNYACAFDIETTTIRAGELDYKGGEDTPPVAFPYLFQWNIYGRVVMVRTYDEAADVFAWIVKYFRLAKNRRLVFFVHNLNYEYMFCRDIWDIDVKASFAVDMRHPVTVITNDGLMFRDSYKLTNMSLETLTRDFSHFFIKDKELIDYSVLRTPYSPLEPNTLIYSALDVLSLSEAITNYLDGHGEAIYTNCPTSTSFNRKGLKSDAGIHIKFKTEEQRAYIRTLERQKIDADIFKLLSRCARGGNTHHNRKYTGQILYKLLHIDICSSYPTQLVCKPIYPLGVWRKLDAGAPVEDIEYFERNGYCTMFDVVLINARLKPGVAVPYISVSKMVIVKGTNLNMTDNGRYMYGLEQIKISVLGMEWPIIKAQYDFDDAIILGGYFTNKGYLPDIVRRFIMKLYAQKTELKNVENKEVEYLISKQNLNSIYGLCMTSPLRSRYEMTETGIAEADAGDIETFLKKYQRSAAYFVPYSWGVFCACAGRVELQALIDTVGDDFVYCDTDSIFCLNPDKNRPKIKELESDLLKQQRSCGLELTYYDINGKPHEMGTLDEEPQIDAWRCWGAKKYVTVCGGKLTCTIAGVPKKKGAEIIGNIENFNIGLNFRGDVTGKLCLWYNENTGLILHDAWGRPIKVLSNIAMLPVDYLLSLSPDYVECLSIEGSYHWNFTQVIESGVNEE